MGRIPSLIFVHGACVRDAAWWWSQMTTPLAEGGISSVAVPLPSCGEAGEELGDLNDDIDACRRAIAEANGPIVLCGHSYGGMVITEVQRGRVREGTRRIEFQAGHHPFLSRPEAFAQSICAEIGAAH